MNRTSPSPYRRLPALVCLLVLCGAIMGWVALGLVKQHLIATTGDALALAAVDIADKLDVLLAERHGDMRILAGDARMLLGNPSALTAQLAQMNAAYPVYQWIVVTDAAGRVIASSGAISPGADEQDTEWFAAIRSRTDVFIREGRSPMELGGAPVVLLAMSLHDETGQFLGAVAAATALPAMDLLSQNTRRAFQFIPHAGGQFECQILTREGLIFYDSRDDLRQPQQLVKAGLPSAIALARGEPGWIEERHLRRTVPVITGYAPTRGRGEFQGLGWGVLVRLDRSAVLAAVNRVLWRVGLAGGFVMLPLMGALVWSMRRLQKEYGRVTASESHLATTLCSITEGVITTDDAGRVTMTNSAAELFTGWSSSEARGRPLNEVLRLLDSESREPLEPVVVPVASGSPMTGLPQRGVLISPDQTERIVAQTAAPISGAEGASKGMVIVLRDITERLRADERRFATSVRLERQNAALAAQARNPTLRGNDLQAAFCAITEVAARTLNVARASIWLYTDDRSAIRCFDLYEHPADRHSAGIELRLEQFPQYFAALAEDRVIPAHDARSDPRTCEFLTQYLEPLGITSMLDAPIHSEGRLVGVICHEHIGPPHEWTLDEQTFAGSTADLATLSFEVSQRHEAELALQKAHADLEKRVAERTTELSLANAALQDEIAAHKRFEAALRESEARFRELADAVPQFVWTAKPDGMTDYCNRRWCDYTGLTIEQTGGGGWQAVLHPDDVAQAAKSWRSAVESGSPFESEYRLRCAADGSYRWHLARAMAVRDASGRVIRWFGTGTDIEQQKRLEAALRESEASFRLLVATIPGLVWTATPGGAVEWVSQRAVEYIGRPAEEIIGAGWQEFVHPDDLAKTLEIWGRSLATGDPAEIEYRLRGGDATYRWHLVRALPLLSPTGPIAKWFGTNVDINDRKRLETALAEARDAALEADRLKSEFLAMMSHELRTPLNSIIGFSGILREEIVGGLNDEQKKQLGMVHSSARHLLGLINDLLDLSRIESGKMDIFVERFRVADVVREVTQVLAPLVQARNLLFQTELHVPDFELRSDRKKVFQILLNLANNAVKFTEKGRVTIVTRAAANAVVFEVSDTGIGITPEQLANLFQAFRQADGSARRLYEGTGLGLYLCKKLVTLLGGSIGAESEFGVGSRFRFTIPLNPPA